MIQTNANADGRNGGANRTYPRAAAQCRNMPPMVAFNLPTWIAGLPVVVQLIIYIGILTAIGVAPLILWFLWAFRPESKQPDSQQ